MQSTIKNISKIFGFSLMLLLPYWICRFVMWFLYSDLAIMPSMEYLLCALRFDLKVLSIWYSPLFVALFLGLFVKKRWWRKLCTFLFGVLFLSALIFGLIAIFYYQISKTIVGTDIFQMLAGQNLTIILSYIMDYWWAIVLTLIFVWFIIKLEKKIQVDTTVRDSFILSFILLVCLVFFARGTIALKPLNLMDAYGMLSNKEATTAVTPTYVLIESFGKKPIIYEEYISNFELRELLKTDNRELLVNNARRSNICLILLESFGKEYTGLNTSKRPSYTPFLDSLMTVSTNYTNSYANGLRSMDAVASIYCGVPSFMKRPFIGSLYTNSVISSLPKSLKKQGYYTSFFHGADELSMGFKPFLLAQGLDEYVGMQQYPNKEDYDGTWGIFDKPFLQFFADKLAKQNQPWFSSVFTLSSHHPYIVPQGYNFLSKGTAAIHHSIGYTDAALRVFFETAKNESWFQNTIFIITADHSSINESKQYTNYRGKYAIPLLIYEPGKEPRRDSSVVQQIDLFTTIKSFAGIDKTVSFTPPLSDTGEHYSFQFDGNVYVCTSDSFSLVWSGTGKPALFAYRNDYAHLYNISDKHPEVVKQMLHELKVFRQKFNYRLLNNDFN